MNMSQKEKIFRLYEHIRLKTLISTQSTTKVVFTVFFLKIT